jgi:uncharacterized glyoxalase superfamily protein PhnB
MANESAFGGDLINASMPTATVIPILNYADVAVAATWLCRVFGFRQRLRIGEHRIQLEVGAGAIVIAKLDAAAGLAGHCNHAVMVRVLNVGQHFETAVQQGATVFGEPVSMPYGERQYSATDLGGHHWTFSQSEASVDPQLWGGSVV